MGSGSSPPAPGEDMRSGGGCAPGTRAAGERRSPAPRAAVVQAQRSPLRGRVAQRSTPYSLCVTIFKDDSESDVDSRERGRRGYTFNVTWGPRGSARGRACGARVRH